MYVDVKSNKLYSIISSTFSDEGLADEMNLGIYKVPFRNMGTILERDAIKNIIIQTNNNL